MNVQERVDEVAFCLLHLSPDDRERVFQEAFEVVQIKRPGLTDIPLGIVDFMAAVFERVAQIEQLGIGHA
jgi:hypothetical protein